MGRPRNWLLRRAMGRLRIDDDIVRHLSTFQRLGETLEVESPGELLPVGARTVFRALRTRAAAQLGSDWVWPYWLQAQLDPASAAFVPRGHLPFLTNVTARNWTAVGNLDSRWEAVVDPRGLVTPWFDGWSLDWWVASVDSGAPGQAPGERWYVPATESSARVRQHLVDATPVVETALRVPGGDIAHRAYATYAGRREVVAVELENRSSAPVAVALAIRPYNAEGLAVIERIALHGTTVTVDGRVALWLPRAPAASAMSTFFEGDSASVVLAGAAPARPPGEVRDKAGMAQAAFVYPLPHAATLRSLLPLTPERRTRRRGRAGRRVARAAVEHASVAPAARVASGWHAQTQRGMRLVLPDERLSEAVEANRRFMLVLHDGDEITPGPSTYHRFWFRDAAFMLAALDRYGFHDEAAQVLRSYPSRQRVDGFFLSQPREWDANGCALWALDHHRRMTGDQTLVDEMVPSITKGANWIERKRRTRRREAPELLGLFPAGISAEHLGPFDFFYWDDFWGVAGLRSASAMLAAAGEKEAAVAASDAAASFLADIESSLAIVARRLGTAAMPAGPSRRIDAGVIGSLVACEPLGLLAPDDVRVEATTDVVRDRFLRGEAFFQEISHTGLGTYLTLQLASVELAAGDRRAWPRLRWLLDAATPTWTWPEAIHPRLPGGCMGDGHHGWAAADFLSFVRNLCVRDVEGGLAFCSVWPDEWLGRDLEVHGAPTHAGVLSFAVRWHGARPALLWELQPHDGGGGPLQLTAPGLDPSWRDARPAGEALLAPIEPPGGLPSTYAAPPGGGSDAPDIGESFA